jgi:hypothetical protein
MNKEKSIMGIFATLIVMAIVLHNAYASPGESYKIYLSGKVRKSTQIPDVYDWRDFYVRNITRKDIQLLTPEYIEEDNSKRQLIFGRDCKLIQLSDLVLVNGTEQLGAGTAQEIMVAKYFKKPVLIVLPINSHHRKSSLVTFQGTIEDWISPFIFETTDFIAESHDAAILFINDIEKLVFSKNIKDITVIDKAQRAFELTKENLLKTASLN